MSTRSQSQSFAGRATVMFLTCVIAIAAAGYFVGINDGAPRADIQLPLDSLSTDFSVGTESLVASTSTIPAVHYSEMRRSETGPTSRWKQSLAQIPQPKYDLFAEIKPSETEKQRSTLTRASRRAFNGAPPVIPHLVEKTSSAACYACHGRGMRIGDRVANRMSHPFLANCTQCHAVPPPKPFTEQVVPAENTFVGLPAPMKGQRAFSGAPPTIPHSTWMRQQCLSCHGNKGGWAGIQSTHPWRTQCLQCHGQSAVLEQAVAGRVEFLSAPNVNSP